jgi:hypothetical protein
MNTRRATTLSSILLVGALLAAGCTSADGEAADGAEAATDRAGSAQDAPAAVPAELSDPAAVAAGRTPAEVAAALSRGLFTSAPAVVVALATDPAAVSAGAEQADKAGIPLLLDDGTGSAAADEAARLKSGSVLALGAGVADRLGSTGAKVLTDAGQLPAVTRTEARPDTAVLVSSASGAAAKAVAAAATATAKAAGAAVVPVAGTDPRADGAAVEALAKAKPAHVLAAGSGFGSPEKLAARVAVAATGVQLPGGGQVVLPGRRLVAMYGHPGTASLGVLGEQGLDASIARARTLAAPYEALSGKTPVVPAFELIATVAQGSPGSGNDYSYEAPVSLLKPWVDKAGKEGVYVVLDLQPGRTNFLDQAKLYESLLKLPHVGLALDPEWRLKPNEKPLEQIGSTNASEINSVQKWLADLTAANNLPQKLLVIHQFRLDMITGDEPLRNDRDEVALLIHMDGQGPTGSKDATWAAVVGAAPKGVPFGWKNFYDEDEPMLTPAQTMIRKPTPLMISYQ